MKLDADAIAAALDQFAAAATALSVALRAEVKRAVLAETPSKSSSDTKPRRESKPTPLPRNDAPAGADKMRRAILIALAQFGKPMSTAQIGIYSGKAHKGGAFAKAISELRYDECVEGPGDANKITAKGLEELGDWARLPEGYRLLEFWIEKLGTMEGQILRAVSLSEQEMSPAEIGQAIDKAHTGGAFAKALSRLRKMNLITRGNRTIGLSPFLRAAIQPTIGVFDRKTGHSVRIDRHGHKAGA